MPAAVFFFQAEDGIRAFHVTGVQTCALPISRNRALAAFARHSQTPCKRSQSAIASAIVAGVGTLRSEERRVGKESSARRGACGHEDSPNEKRFGEAERPVPDRGRFDTGVDQA